MDYVYPSERCGLAKAALLFEQEGRIAIDGADSAVANVRSFGVVVGKPDTRRIFSLSISSQVEDPDGFSRVSGSSVVTADKGYQLHMFTRERDLLIVRVPPGDLSFEAFELVYSAVRLNRQIWDYFTGIKLASPSRNHVVMVSEKSGGASFTSHSERMGKFSFRYGTLDQVSKELFFEKGGQIVLPILSPSRIQGIGVDSLLESVAACVSALNDKNRAIPLLKRSGVPVPETHLVNEAKQVAGLRSRLDPGKRYVFKLAGSVAGIGMFTNHDRGCSPEEIMEYVACLKKAGKAPRRFQVQELVRGKSYGGIVSVDQRGNVRLLSVHQQIVDEGRFMGLLWKPEFEARFGDFVMESVRSLLGQKVVSLLGSVNIDFMASEDGKLYVVEVNPRYSAGVPFATIRSSEPNIQKKFSCFAVESMFLASNIPFSKQALKSGTLLRVVQDLHRKCKVVILPQGINPFGNSSVLFVNNPEGKGRAKFMEYVTGGERRDLP